MSQSKIFGIGLAKTGTTSLSEALRILDYSTIDYPLDLEGVNEHDAATDIPIADSFRLLDHRYPGSKFIYTVRERSEWLGSSMTHWARSIDSGRLTNARRAMLIKRLYGTIDFDAKLFAEAYDRHESHVFAYFANRHDDLLVLDICRGENGWEPLCAFLRKEVPDHPFPQANKTNNAFQYYLRKSAKHPLAGHAQKYLKKIQKKMRRIVFNTQSR
jgi:hypothetical protein